jgi:hypothetical protein
VYGEDHMRARRMLIHVGAPHAAVALADLQQRHHILHRLDRHDFHARHCGLLRQYLCFCTRKARTVAQYLCFCTSKASK